jgi:hypothetical protein
VSRLLGVAAFALLAASCRSAKREVRCFDLTVGKNSATTTAVFEARQCQGGGVTWAGLLRVLVKRHGPSTVPDEPVPGWTGDVRRLGATTFSIDEEGDAARFCADDGALVAAMRQESAALNASKAALEAAMDEADPLDLECFTGEDVLEGVRDAPAPGPAELQARREARDRLDRALRTEREWCWPQPNDFAEQGLLRFEFDGGVTQTSLDRRTVWRTGEWHADPDGRIEVTLEPTGRDGGSRSALLHHFDVGTSGRLGFNLLEREVRRMDLVPASACDAGRR